MAETTGVPEYDDAAVQRIHDFVESVTGGKIVRMEQQVRWRPAWFADVEVDGKLVELHLRGDRTGDVAIFPDLKREADIIAVLHGQGIPVPAVYGYLADPPCIVMESIKGTRDLSGLTPEKQSVVGRAYMKAVAAMHALPVEAFAEVGDMNVPQGAEEIALVGLNTYLPQYLRTKKRPEPLLEFVIQWIRRNVPKHRTRAAFIQFDSGQFLVHEERMTQLYDFEFSMIGDPMVDLATMGMRNTIEPLGAPMPELFGYYAEASGEPVDHEAVLFHVLQFSLLGTMQFTGTVADPRPADPHSVYLQFDLALRRSILLALSKLAGVPLPELPQLEERRGDNATLIRKLADTLSGIASRDAVAEGHKGQALEIVEWVARADTYGAAMVAQNIAEVSAFLGQDFARWPEAEAALEAFVMAAGPDQDAGLITLLGAIEGRRLQVFGPTSIGEAALNVRLPEGI
ncbi:phosphotransferase [Novosphingobium sp. CCH12-A3]|uniref:phosphotransferase n=1 Tax=Novosphingobium sp. CCH12-A3 TaxID=1768752 RepID=UPI000785E8F1|nr:phosphotransferase [Novosphingobium sp. CCH12-A3]